MLFNSIHFLIFFPVVLFMYYSLPHRSRWMMLLIASYYFYMCWKPEYLVLILISTIIAYSFALLMEGCNDKSKKIYLMISIISNLGILFCFKYLNFFSGSLNIILQKLNIFSGSPVFNLLLPIGISFYTFQTLSYSIDVFRGETKPERHFGFFALFVSFFPQLVSGPIERSDKLIPQFYKKVNFNPDLLRAGIILMLWGFFKKLVVADRLAILVDRVYNNPASYNGFNYCFATIFFAFQIYCDFSGYSDIAVGAAQTMGIRLTDNFRRPYFSKSIAEFWRRWHISLSSWFRDYLYIPLGGNRVKKCRLYYNLIITFLIGGLWHGANWTFMLWGMLHGFYMVFSNITQGFRVRISGTIKISKIPLLYDFVRIFITFILVCFAWIFFRANNIGDAFLIISKITTGWRIIFHISALQRTILSMGLDKYELTVAIISIVTVLLVQIIQRYKIMTDILKERNPIIRWFVYYTVILLIIIFGKFKEQAFIYFQF